MGNVAEQRERLREVKRSGLNLKLRRVKSILLITILPVTKLPHTGKGQLVPL